MKSMKNWTIDQRKLSINFLLNAFPLFFRRKHSRKTTTDFFLLSHAPNQCPLSLLSPSFFAPLSLSSPATHSSLQSIYHIVASLFTNDLDAPLFNGDLVPSLPCRSIKSLSLSSLVTSSPLYYMSHHCISLHQRPLSPSPMSICHIVVSLRLIARSIIFCIV